MINKLKKTHTNLAKQNNKIHLKNRYTILLLNCKKKRCLDARPSMIKKIKSKLVERQDKAKNLKEQIMKKFILGILVTAFIITAVSVGSIGCAKKKSLESLEISAQPGKTIYNAGEKFDKTGMEVKAVYSDKSKEKITDYKLDKDMLKYGDDKVTVSYKQKKAYIDVKVKDYSVYELTTNFPDEIKADQDYSVEVGLKAKEKRDYGHDKILIYVDVEKPDEADVSLVGTDSMGNSYDVSEIGYWGTPSGFAITNDYDVTSTFTARFTRAGDYKFTISAHTLGQNGDKDKQIASKEVEVNVKENDGVNSFDGMYDNNAGNYPETLESYDEQNYGDMNTRQRGGRDRNTKDINNSNRDTNNQNTNNDNRDRNNQDANDNEQDDTRMIGNPDGDGRDFDGNYPITDRDIVVYEMEEKAIAFNFSDDKNTDGENDDDDTKEKNFGPLAAIVYVA